jgi:electron transfer flavoprotein beta subunit
VLTGVQAHDDLDGSVGPLLAEYLGMPYVGYVSGVAVSGGVATVRKEYPGGLIGEMKVTLPALLGIQAADEPPRYVPISKIRQFMKTASIDEQVADALDRSGAPSVTRLFEPEAAERATMIEGDEEEIATRLVEIFQEAGIL